MTLEIKVGQWVIPWHPYIHRPAVARRPLQVEHVGKRVRVSATGSRVFLLKPEDILAVFDDKEEADAKAELLHQLADSYRKKEAELMGQTITAILEAAKK